MNEPAICPVPKGRCYMCKYLIYIKTYILALLEIVSARNKIGHATSAHALT